MVFAGSTEEYCDKPQDGRSPGVRWSASRWCSYTEWWNLSLNTKQKKDLF